MPWVKTSITYTKSNGETREIITNTAKNPIVHFTPKYITDMDSEYRKKYMTWLHLPFIFSLGPHPEVDHTHVRVYDEINEGWRTLICGHGDVGIKNVWDLEYVKHC